MLWGDGPFLVGRTGAWGVERREVAVGGPQEAVLHETRVIVQSRDRAQRVDASGRGPDGGRDVKRGQGAVRGPQKTVTPNYVFVKSRNRARRVDAPGSSIACAWDIERNDGLSVGAAREGQLQATKDQAKDD